MNPRARLIFAEILLSVSACYVITAGVPFWAKLLTVSVGLISVGFLGFVQGMQERDRLIVTVWGGDTASIARRCYWGGRNGWTFADSLSSQADAASAAELAALGRLPPGGLQ